MTSARLKMFDQLPDVGCSAETIDGDSCRFEDDFWRFEAVLGASPCCSRTRCDGG